MRPPGQDAGERPPRGPPPGAFLFFGIFSGFEAAIEEVRRRIEAHYGRLHALGVSPLYPFPETATYRESMGPRLQRRFFVLDALWPQDELAPVKRHALEIEDALRASGAYPVARPVNIDPGLLNDCRIILASTKDHAHRLYRGEGIWEEITLIFTKGAYRPLPWTYADFRDGAYHAFFEALRDDLLVRTGKRQGPPRTRA